MATTTKVIIPGVRFSYAHVFEPTSVEEGGKKKYSVSIIIPKKDKKTLKAIEEAIQLAFEQGVTSKFGGKKPATWKNPLRDGDVDRPDDEAYEDSMFINASSDRKPGIVDADVNEILDREEFYSGCYGRASVNFYPFNFSGSKGVAAGLQNLQKLDDGDRLSGGASAAEDFGKDDDDLS